MGNSKITNGIVIALVTVLLALVVYSAGQANSANTKYDAMSTKVTDTKLELNGKVTSLEFKITSHEATQSASEKAIVDKLDEVKVELTEQRKEQRVLLEKILELQITVAGRHSEDG